jgi:hypothetical protein
MFERFLSTFPIAGANAPVNADSLAGIAESDLGVSIPNELKAFWSQVGSGYFGEKVLYFFGDGVSQQPRDSFIDWNKKDFWQGVYPPAKDGGPVFFAETCFGDQVGFRIEGGRYIYIMFCVDTFDAFVIAKSGMEFFEYLITDKYALLDEARFDAISNKFGSLQLGMHYAPIVSPLLGGSGEIDNFGLKTPNIHFRTAIANFSIVNA